jgi:hypothetical protein
MGAYPHRYFVILFIAGGLLLSALLSLPVMAQSGCTGDPCVFYTPTGTSTSVPTATAGPGTPTAVPMAATVVFPHPNYAAPTSIPAATFPTVSSSGYNPATLAWPSPLAITVTPLAVTTPNLGSITETDLSTAQTGLSISYRTPMALSSSTSISGSGSYTVVDGLAGDLDGFVGDMVSYTDYLSTTAANIVPTGTFTVITAPDWYAPAMPRPAANVGWTFEQLRSGVELGSRYSLPAWAGFTGYITSIPFQLVKLLYQLVQFLGPLGLFLAWLLIMFPIVLWMRFFLFIKNTFVSFLNFIVKIVSFVLSLVKFVIELFL